MASLEEKIREAIIKREAEENYQMFQNPDYTKMIREASEKIFKPIFELIVMAKPSLSKAGWEPLVDQLLNQILSPENLKKLAYQSAKEQYLTAKELETEIKKINKEFKENLKNIEKDPNIGDEMLELMKKKEESSIDGKKQTFDRNNKIISALVEIAEEEGIEKAISKETHYSVIRKIFPTFEEFVASIKNGREAILSELPTFQAAETSDKSGDAAIGATMINVINSMNDDLFSSTLYNRAKEIYGKEDS